MKKFRDYIAEIIAFFREEKGLKLDPEPTVKLDSTAHSRFDPYAPTGHYDFTKNEITLYISNRHCKDILRTLCHELIHVSQYQRDPEGYASFNKGGSLIDNPVLRKTEEEAYKKGNLFFRDWTEKDDE
jgi:hypothetical protein